MDLVTEEFAPALRRGPGESMGHFVKRLLTGKMLYDCCCCIRYNIYNFHRVQVVDRLLIIKELADAVCMGQPTPEHSASCMVFAVCTRCLHSHPTTLPCAAEGHTVPDAFLTVSASQIGQVMVSHLARSKYV